MDSSILEIMHRPAEQRFESRVDSHCAYLYYEHAADDHVVLLSTYVPPPLRGQGVGRRLVIEARDMAAREGWQLSAQCWYAALVLEELRELGS